MKSFSKIFLIVAVVVLTAAGCTGVPRDGKSTKVYDKAAENFQPAQTVRYEGQAGKTALEILKANYQVETKDYPGLGEFVVSIGGITPDSKHFWQFVVNGQPAQVGASSYQTQNGDQIEWRLEEIKN